VRTRLSPIHVDLVVPMPFPCPPIHSAAREPRNASAAREPSGNRIAFETSLVMIHTHGMDPAYLFARQPVRAELAEYPLSCTHTNSACLPISIASGTVRHHQRSARLNHCAADWIRRRRTHRSEAEFAAGHVEGAINVPIMFMSPGGMTPNPDFVAQVTAAIPDKECQLLLVGTLPPSCLSRMARVKGVVDLDAVGALRYDSSRLARLARGWRKRALTAGRRRRMNHAGLQERQALADGRGGAGCGGVYRHDQRGWWLRCVGCQWPALRAVSSPGSVSNLINPSLRVASRDGYTAGSSRWGEWRSPAAPAPGEAPALVQPKRRTQRHAA
jgi:hypothetical protein